MQIITTQEFNANQNKYFALAGEEAVVITRQNEPPVFLYVGDDEDALTIEEAQSLQKALEDAKHGRVARKMKGESLEDFLMRTGNV